MLTTYKWYYAFYHILFRAIKTSVKVKSKNKNKHRIFSFISQNKFCWHNMHYKHESYLKIPQKYFVLPFFVFHLNFVFFFFSNLATFVFVRNLYRGANWMALFSALIYRINNVKTHIKYLSMKSKRNKMLNYLQWMIFLLKIFSLNFSFNSHRITDS